VNLKLGGGAFDDEEKVAEFFVGLPTETFGDVGHNRHGGTTHLIFEPIVAGEFGAGGELVDAFGELSCFLPDFEVFEAGYRF